MRPNVSVPAAWPDAAAGTEKTSPESPRSLLTGESGAVVAAGGSRLSADGCDRRIVCFDSDVAHRGWVEIVFGAKTLDGNVDGMAIHIEKTILGVTAVLGSLSPVAVGQ